MSTPLGNLYEQVKRVLTVANQMQSVTDAVKDMGNDIRDIDRRLARLEGAFDLATRHRPEPPRITESDE
jgi:hypothetical protein